MENKESKTRLIKRNIRGRLYNRDNQQGTGNKLILRLSCFNRF